MNSPAAKVADATPSDALNVLANEENSALIDVRTRPEWMFVGLPVLPGGKDPILLEWQEFPAMTVNSAFADELAKACPDKDAPLFFLCRSGARSLAAAQRMTALGYTRCFNVVDGFEGPPDAEGHRGTTLGWKASGCPWRQS